MGQLNQIGMVIPAYNAEPYVATAIESCLNQAPPSGPPAEFSHSWGSLAELLTMGARQCGMFAKEALGQLFEIWNTKGTEGDIDS